MNIFGWFINLFTGNVLDKVLGIVDKKIDSEVEKEKLKTEITTKYLQAQVDSSIQRKEAFGGWAWFMAFLFLPGPALWWNMVFLVSAFPGWLPGYEVLALPPDFYPWMTTIIGALFFIPTINKIFTR